MNVETVVWKQLIPSGSGLPARLGHSAVLDEATGRMYVFGGCSVRSALLLHSDLLTYDARTNRSDVLTPGGPLPPGRFGHSSIWDTASASMYVFGGCSLNRPYGWAYTEADDNDVWAYRAKANVWEKADSVGTRPPGRLFHKAAWDGSNRVMYVLGGRSGYERWEDLWAFSASTNQWTQCASIVNAVLGDTVLGYCSAGIAILAAAYHVGEGRLHVVGCSWPVSLIGGPQVRGRHFWCSYTPSSNSWSAVRLLPGANPYSTDGQSAVWDQGLEQVLLFGGRLGAEKASSNVWIYSVQDHCWTLAVVAVDGPLGREAHSAVWDAVAGGMYVFGGATENESVSNELWMCTRRL